MRSIAADSGFGLAGRDSAREQSRQNETRRDLVTVGHRQQPGTTVAADGRPSANFLAHLIATAQQVPQARERRRAEPGDVVRQYDAVADSRQIVAAITSRLT